MRILACLVGSLLLFVDLVQYVAFMAGWLQFADAGDAIGTLPLGHFFMTFIFGIAGIGLFCIGYFAKPKEIEVIAPTRSKSTSFA